MFDAISTDRPGLISNESRQIGILIYTGFRVKPGMTKVLSIILLSRSLLGFAAK